MLMESRHGRIEHVGKSIHVGVLEKCWGNQDILVGSSHVGVFKTWGESSHIDGIETWENRGCWGIDTCWENQAMLEKSGHVGRFRTCLKNGHMLRESGCIGRI